MTVKKMPVLSHRLSMLADMVTAGSKIADVGTDHGYLPAWLILNGVINHAIASDLRQGPLRRAEETARQYGLTDRIELKQCDGLDGLRPGESDTVIIAGMGGEKICGILERTPWLRQSRVELILQPMSTQPELRRWLLENGYRIEEERLAREGKTIYVAFRVFPGWDRSMSEGELEVGRQSQDPLRGCWLDWHLDRLHRILEGLNRAEHIKELDNITRTEEQIRELNAMKKEWELWQL